MCCKHYLYNSYNMGGTDVATKNWKILAYLRNAIEESKEEIVKPKPKEDLINDVLKLRDLKRTELTLQHILEKDGDK